MTVAAIKTSSMRDSIRTAFPTGRTLASTLAHVSQGMAADALLEGKAGELIGDGSLLLLPRFAIRLFDGSESLNLIQWDGPTCRMIAAGQSAQLRWKVEDSSLETLAGTLVLTPSAGGHTITGELPPTPDSLAPDLSAVLSPAQGQLQLRRISRRGASETFQLARLISTYARSAVLSADVRVYREIHGVDESGSTDSQVGHVLDSVERDVVVDRLLWGEEGSGSIVIRLLRRVAATDMSRRKNVTQIIATGIWSGAETLVRQHIGDPHLGRVIRRVARALKTTDPERVLDAYRESHPQQRVGMNRVVAALTAGSTVHTRSVPMLDGEGAVA